MILRIFPEGSLAESVTTTVWIGVLVISLLNLRFGWTFSGLVTPGYLVPLMILRPWSAGMIVVQALISYWLVWFFSQYLSRWGKWSNFFGRDRFFAIVLASIGVKVAIDGYLVPWLGKWLQDRFGLSLDLGNTLHSFGLIVVALLANQFWKPGFFRGLGPVCVTIAITYLIVRYPLMHWTNFSIGTLEYLYEDIATSILASPKAYVILVVTAFMASRMNLMYSWDYNGILIPALLALQWYEPLKILSSLVEAYTVFLLGSLVLRLPAFKETTMEGARKILLFFNISYAYKLVLGHAAVLLELGLPAGDLYGFGYLLPSLMAMKMHDKKIPIRLARTTLQTCLAGAAVACVLGFGLTVATQSLFADRPPAVRDGSDGGDARPLSLTEQVSRCNLLRYERRLQAKLRSPTVGEIEDFKRGLSSLARYLRGALDEDLQAARGWLDRVGYRVSRGQGDLIFLEERAPGHGWGLYALNLSARCPILVGIPAPEEEWATMEAGGYVFGALGARALAISTLVSRPGAPASREILTGHGTFFGAFHGVFASGGGLHVRGYTERSARALLGKRVRAGTEELERLPTTLWITRGIPTGLSPDRLLADVARDRAAAPEHGKALRWKRVPMKNVARDTTRAGFGELFLGRKDRKRLLPRFLLGLREKGDASTPGDWLEEVRGSSLDRVIGELGSEIAPRGSNLYVPPSVESILFLDEEVLKPLLDLASRPGKIALHEEEALLTLAPVARSARVFGYKLVALEDPNGRDYLILREDPEAAERKYWGTCIFRAGDARPFVVEVPRPIFEQNTIEYGLELFQDLEARCLLVSGAHPRCNADGSADVILPSNSLSFFNLANQVILRDTGADPLLVVQVRALGPRPGSNLPGADALVSFLDGASSRGSLGPLEEDLVRRLDRERLSWRLVDGDEETGGFEAQGSAQARYLVQTKGKNFAALWLSPFLRLGYRDQADDVAQENQMAALGISTEERDGDLYEILRSAPRGGPIPDEMEIRKLVLEYRRLQNINVLYGIVARLRGYRLRRIVDAESRKPFLLLFEDGGRLAPLVVSLGYDPALDGTDGGAGRAVVASGLTRQVVREFIATGAEFLSIEGPP